MTSIDQEGFVEFRFFRRDMRDVRIVGDIADAWDSGFAMQAGSDGWWHARMPLQPGEYRFRYVADGTCYTEYASNGVEVTKSGVTSVLVVPERKDQTPTRAAKIVA